MSGSVSGACGDLFLLHWCVCVFDHVLPITSLYTELETENLILCEHGVIKEIEVERIYTCGERKKSFV